MITEQAVARVAELARLKLSAQEVDRFQKELGAILDFVEQLKSLAVENVAPTTSINGAVNVAREDTAERLVAMSAPEQLLKQAPERKGDFVKVKAILK